MLHSRSTGFQPVTDVPINAKHGFGARARRGAVQQMQRSATNREKRERNQPEKPPRLPRRRMSRIVPDCPAAADALSQARWPRHELRAGATDAVGHLRGTRAEALACTSGRRP